MLGATCCGYVYHAQLDTTTNLFQVVLTHMDMTNVYLLPRDVDYGPDKA